MSDTEQKVPLNHDNQDSSRTENAADVKPDTLRETADDSDNETISVKVTDNQTEVTFRVKKKTPLHRVMDSFCKRTGKDPNSLRFTFDGERVAKDDTPGSLGMEDNDKIEALNQQTGGC